MIPITDEQRRLGQEVRLAKRAAILAQRVLLSGDAHVEPDSLPGIGWIFRAPKKANRYYATKELALADASSQGYLPL